VAAGYTIFCPEFSDGEHGGTPYIVMELLDGEDLQRVITGNRPLKSGGQSPDHVADRARAKTSGRAYPMVLPGRFLACVLPPTLTFQRY
jgi:hypothetical protein